MRNISICNTCKNMNMNHGFMLNKFWCTFETEVVKNKRLNSYRIRYDFRKEEVPEECPYKLEQLVMEKNGINRKKV